MPKAAVTYQKHDEPQFIKDIKQRLGIQVGPTVQTKKLGLEQDLRSNQDCDDEQPQVVVLKAGDLTAEEVTEIEKSQIKEEEEQEDPADLTKPITFKKPKRSCPLPESSNKTDRSAGSKSKKAKKSILSFVDDDS